MKAACPPRLVTLKVTSSEAAARARASASAGKNGSSVLFTQKVGTSTRHRYRSALERMMKFLRERYGKPVAEGPDPVKLAWKDKGAHAVLTAEPKRRRASLLVSRGTFEEEIYKVR